MTDKLQKIMSRAGIGSRRHNERLISSGKVLVNGRVARLGDRADANIDSIEVNGKPIKIQPHIYIKMNKPKGVLSSTEDELSRGRITLLDLVDTSEHIYPVGRLDKESEGLILLTNDGDMANRLTHPRYQHDKEYFVSVQGLLGPETAEQWRNGVILDGKKTAPAGIVILASSEITTQLHVTMTEGRKRQIRRVASALGHPVIRLIRTRIGSLTLGKLPTGEWKYLTKKEVNALRRVIR